MKWKFWKYNLLEPLKYNQGRSWKKVYAYINKPDRNTLRMYLKIVEKQKPSKTKSSRQTQ